MNCSDKKREISEMSVFELRSAASDVHVGSCANCNRYLNDMLAISDGLASLVIPHPAGMQRPVRQTTRRERWLTLAAAILVMILVGTVGAYVYQSYYAEDPCSTGSRRIVSPDPGPPRTAEPPRSVK